MPAPSTTTNLIPLIVEGIPRPVQVDPSFRDLPSHEQEATVEQIRAAWDAQNAPGPESDANRRARAQRQLAPRPLTDDEVSGSAAAAPPVRDTSYGGAVRESASSLTRGLGSTARVVGNAIDSPTLRGIGTSLTGALPADPNYEAATPQLVDAVRRVEVGRALGHLPRAVVENVGSLGATLAGGAVGGAVAGPPGAFLGAYTAAGAQTLGPNVEARAANNGRQEPNSDDLVAGGLTTAAQAGLEAFGAVGRGARLITNPVTRPSGVVARAHGLAGRSLREGASEVADETVQQIGTSIGTERGLNVDPAEALAAGLIGTGTRVALGAPGAALRGGLESSVRIATDLTRGEMTPDEAASVLRINHLLSRRYDSQSRSADVNPEDLLDGARTELDGGINRQLRRLRADGWLHNDDGEARGNYQQLRDVFETARRHNQNLATDAPTEGDYSPAEGLRVVDEVLARAPETLRENTKSLLRDLDTLAAASRKKNLVGPFATIGDVAGRMAAVGGGAAAGGLPGAVAGLAMSLGGNPLAARAGRHLGGMVDRAAGLGVPPPVLARVAAQRVLRRAGVVEDRTPGMLLAENDATLVDRARMRRAALGLPPAPPPAAPAVVDAMQPPGSLPVGPPSAETQAAGQPLGSPLESASASGTSEAIGVPPTPVPAAGGPASESMGPAVQDAQRRVTLRALEKLRVPAASPAQPAATDSNPAESPQQERPRKGALHGWRAFVQSGVARKGRVATQADIEGAVRSLAAEGILEPDEADAMFRERGRIEDLTLLDEVIHRVAETQGWNPADAPDMQLTAAASQYAGIRSPARWDSARTSYQDAAARAVDAGNQAGDFDLAELANTLSVSTDAQLPGAVRKLRVEALIAGSQDPVMRARRSAFLRPLIARLEKADD